MGAPARVPAPHDDWRAWPRPLLAVDRLRRAGLDRALRVPRHQHRRAAEADAVDAVVVATDDQRIADAVAAFGGVARMTRSTHRTGTDRIAEVAADLACDIVVNVQGDEPLIDPAMITAVVAPLRARLRAMARPLPRVAPVTRAMSVRS